MYARATIGQCDQNKQMAPYESAYAYPDGKNQTQADGPLVDSPWHSASKRCLLVAMLCYERPKTLKQKIEKSVIGRRNYYHFRGTVQCGMYNSTKKLDMPRAPAIYRHSSPAPSFLSHCFFSSPHSSSLEPRKTPSLKCIRRYFHPFAARGSPDWPMLQ